MLTLLLAAVFAIDKVNLNAGKLSWRGIALGDTRAAVEKKLGGPLEVVRFDETPTCGEYHAGTELAGNGVTIQFSGPSATATVQSIFVWVEGEELRATPHQLSERLKKRIPGLVYAPAPGEVEPADQSPAYRPSANPKVTIIVKPSIDEGFWLILTDCID